MIRCVVFDFDGTLVDSNTIKRQAFLRIAARDSEEALMKDVLASESGDRYAIFSKFAASRIGTGQADSRHRAVKLALEYTNYCEEAIAVCPEMSGASAMLDDLKREGLLLALNSATPTNALTAIVSRRGWHDYFSLVLGSPSSKAENLVHIADDLGFEHEELVMVGDRRADQKGAIEFGCHFIGVICADSDFDAQPPYAVNALAQLSSEIRRLRT
jgi:phosphoglycolate phosphatase